MRRIQDMTPKHAKAVVERLVSVLRREPMLWLTFIKYLDSCKGMPLVAGPWEHQGPHVLVRKDRFDEAIARVQYDPAQQEWVGQADTATGSFSTTMEATAWADGVLLGYDYMLCSGKASAP